MPEDTEASEWGVTPDDGFAIPMTEEESELWRTYRNRRDLIGEGLESDLAQELTKQDGAVPADYHDQALARAIEFLKQNREKTGEK